ncbi:MAG: hypothetical protein H6732_06015 [Alphaproteobacteria bacterium]|nr:hypothetical protein [Alphaproteobacteria bacterium]
MRAPHLATLLVLLVSGCGAFQPFDRDQAKNPGETDQAVLDSDTDLPDAGKGGRDTDGKKPSGGRGDTFEGSWDDSDPARDTDFGVPGKGDSGAGDSGSTGDSGSAGDSGSTGDSGSAGDSGSPGDSGSAGDSGSTGDSGLPGFGDLGCRDLCYWSADGLCDDGGAGADSSLCPYGSDCSDCGPRALTPSGGLCVDTCRFAGDGECDDGAPPPYALTAACAFGTDCTDCGPRNAAMHCENTCEPDGVCDEDDGTCPFLTDCYDCGGLVIP